MEAEITAYKNMYLLYEWMNIMAFILLNMLWIEIHISL